MCHTCEVQAFLWKRFSICCRVRSLRASCTVVAEWWKAIMLKKGQCFCSRKYDFIIFHKWNVHRKWIKYSIKWYRYGIRDDMWLLNAYHMHTNACYNINLLRDLFKQKKGGKTWKKLHIVHIHTHKHLFVIACISVYWVFHVSFFHYSKS